MDNWILEENHYCWRVTKIPTATSYYINLMVSLRP
jgi:hypothetical protein